MSFKHPEADSAILVITYVNVDEGFFMAGYDKQLYRFPSCDSDLKPGMWLARTAPNTYSISAPQSLEKYVNTAKRDGSERTTIIRRLPMTINQFSDHKSNVL